jgi:hypothetical protein
MPKAPVADMWVLGDGVHPSGNGMLNAGGEALT